MRAILPDGDPELGRALVEGFEPAVARDRATRACRSPSAGSQHLGFGVAYRTDIHALHEHWVSTLQAVGGELRLSTPVRSLIVDAAGRVGGVRIAGEELRGARGAARHRRLPGRHGAASSASSAGTPIASLVRSNRGSTGDGFRMARRGGRGGQPRARHVLRAHGRRRR